MNSNVTIGDVLTRGSDILAASPKFKLVGRDEELADLITILMKMRKSNLIITGQGGVGISAIVLGVQASKSDLTTPVDIVGKRMFWLNSDLLFESGNNQNINTMFDRVRRTLTAAKNAVIVIEDTIDFIKASQAHGCPNLINGLMGDLKSKRYQAILESKDDTLGEVLKCDGDILEFCTLYEVKEPSASNLRLILSEMVHSLNKHHGIEIKDSAVEVAASLTEKYKLAELRAQPDAAISLLDTTLADFLRITHKETPDTITEAVWLKHQADLRVMYKDISGAEEEIRNLEETIASERVTSNTVEDGRIGPPSDTPRLPVESQLMTRSKDRIQKLSAGVQEASRIYKDKVAELYRGLSVNENHVFFTFSALSGIPVDKLGEDERQRLRGLEEILSRRVIGQDEPTTEVSKAVRRSRLGLKMPNKPSGTFLFLGPSGVGKTELAKALAEALQVPLLRFDMSEYMEKHAVSKLIGAPPGYEGYEHGGILTNAARRNPYSVVLFDEIEKAHVDVFNVMLQVLDDARLTDSRGLTASFKDTVIIMTTNIGTPHFLNEDLGYAESRELAMADLRAQYRPEFLGRFGGNIYCFQRLQEKVLCAIAEKDISRVNGLLVDRGLKIIMPEQELLKMVRKVYEPKEGARSILGYIDRNITSGIADFVLSDKAVSGKIGIKFDEFFDSCELIPL